MGFGLAEILKTHVPALRIAAGGQEALRSCGLVAFGDGKATFYIVLPGDRTDYAQAVSEDIRGLKGHLGREATAAQVAEGLERLAGYRPLSAPEFPEGIFLRPLNEELDRYRAYTEESLLLIPLEAPGATERKGAPPSVPR